jgi:hypothetical protein
MFSTHIPHLQESTSAITCSCLQRVIAVFGHLRVIRAYFEKCSIDKKSDVSTDYCLSQTDVPSESIRAFVIIEHPPLQVNKGADGSFLELRRVESDVLKVGLIPDSEGQGSDSDATYRIHIGA